MPVLTHSPLKAAAARQSGAGPVATNNWSAPDCRRYCFSIPKLMNELSLSQPGSPQELWTFMEGLQDELSEDGIRPSKPGTCELLRIILMKRLVHEARASVRFLQRIQALLDLAVFGCGQPFDDHAQRPDHVHAHMRSAEAVGRLADAPIRIFCGEQHLAGVEIDLVVRFHA